MSLATARFLRQRMTDAERALWRSLRARSLEGWKFRRQVPIGPYVVDFLCASKKIIVEVDGGKHAKHVAQDAKRTEFLQSQGYRVLRFWNNEVLQNLEGVLAVILRELVL